jgi:3-oxoacyl-[acyl-carrier protein] reductase
MAGRRRYKTEVVTIRVSTPFEGHNAMSDRHEPHSLRDKVVLITGGGRGIGRAIALRFAAEGAKVAVAARTLAEVQSVAEEITRFSDTPALAIQADVTVQKDVYKMVAHTESDLGPLDVLVNNAGAAIFKPLMDTTVEEWDRLMNINLKATFLCSKAALKGMIERRRGRIINVASAAGLKGYPEQAAYCASKHGAVGFSKVLALEMQKYGIRVNVICPGGVDTQLVREGRDDVDLSKYMRPEEIAEVAVFLAKQEGIATVDEIVVRRTEARPWG